MTLFVYSKISKMKIIKKLQSSLFWLSGILIVYAQILPHSPLLETIKHTATTTQGKIAGMVTFAGLVFSTASALICKSLLPYTAWLYNYKRNVEIPHGFFPIWKHKHPWHYKLLFNLLGGAQTALGIAYFGGLVIYHHKNKTSLQ
jgi:hypothetical protein